ncbi:MAG TPA: ice-binding family protein, partial [Telluria sp.]|nr:ice-binding family protein [Telluria sp.]
DVTANSTFKSGTPAVATIDAATGLALGVSAGPSLITATSGGISNSTTLTVKPVFLQTLNVVPQAPVLQIGATRQLAVMAGYSDGNSSDVTALSTFVSATPANAKAGATGIVTGVAAGTSVITASFGSMNANTTATVNAATLTKIVVTPTPVTIGVTGVQQFVATATYSDTSTAIVTNSVTWTSGNVLIATVLPTGAATGVSAGTTSITATSGLISGVASLTVTAVAPPPPVLNPVNLRTAANFGVLAGTSLTNNSGGLTFVNGDVGSPSQTTPPVVGPTYTNYTSGKPLTDGLADLDAAITDANSRICDYSFANGEDLGGRTLPPGVYCFAQSISVTGKLILSGNGVYIFRTASTLDTTANAIVALANGADAENVFWVPVGPTTLGANGVFLGSILARSAAITIGDMTTLYNGRVLSEAAVTLKNNKINK